MTRAVCAALLALALLAPAARASVDQLSMVMDDNRLLYRGDAVGSYTMRELAGMGVQAVRVSVPWRAIAPDHRADRRPARLTRPADPAQYPAAAFHALDRVVRDAHRLGMEVLFNVTGGAPLWATGRRAGRHVGLEYMPDARQFGAFVRMLGRRYSGRWRQAGELVPRVEEWSIWNEPNQGALLQPQWRGGRPYSPQLYRALARAAISALQSSGHAHDQILLGETAPLGVDRRGATASMRPGLFIRDLLCLDTRLHALHGAEAARRGCDFVAHGPLAVTGYAHHPYSVTSPPRHHDPEPLDITLGDRDRLTRLLDAGARATRVPPGLPLWWTEYGYQTYPPDPLRGVSLTDQVRWLAQAERMTWDDPRVAAMTQFLLRDSKPRSQAPVGSHRYWGTYQSGLEFADGRRKPAYAAYRLPFALPSSVRAGTRMRLWGRVRPLRPGGDASVLLQFAPAGHGWRTVGGPVAADLPGGVFETSIVPPGSGRWRFVWPGGASPRGGGPSAQLTSAALPVTVSATARDRGR